MVKNFKEVSASESDGAGVAIHQVKVLFGHVPDERLDAGEEGRIGKVPLCRHDAVHACALDAAVHVSPVLDVPVGYDRNGDGRSKKEKVEVKKDPCKCKTVPPT